MTDLAQAAQADSVPAKPPASDRLKWGNGRIALTLTIGPDGPVGIVAAGGDSGTSIEVLNIPLVEIVSLSEGRARSSQRYTETAVGARLRYTSHRAFTSGIWQVLEVTQKDRVSGLEVLFRLRCAADTSAVQSAVTVSNHGSSAILLQAVTSLTMPILTDSGPARPDRLSLVSGSSQWLGENQWTTQPLRNLMPDLNLGFHGQDQRGHLLKSSVSTWSTGGDLPVAALLDSDGICCWAWQIEHNGGWSWELGEFRNALAVSLLGPTDEQQQWLHELQPEESFTTVPATVALSRGGLAGVVEELTRHRRALRHCSPTVHRLPVVYNDFMNTLMGNPSTQRLLPLVDAAARAGAEVFCIDAGWYDEGSDWWDAVGEWAPVAGWRFPRGLHEVTEAIRRHGMIVGLWLEPEVIGRRSSMARSLPDSAFLQRRRQRITEHGRHHLDLRDPSAQAHLDGVIDRLVADFGVGYFKLDYNITPGAGTDHDADSPGSGLLGHNRAFLGWLDGIRDRHPDVLIENCASGAMRQDYALLSRLDLQSTSDQQDALLYPPIAANSFLSVLPEQAAHWSYPQPGMDGEQIRFTLATGMLGRMCLSGFLDGMTKEQLALVSDAVAAHKSLLPDIAQAFPFWPAGLPDWDSQWVAVGLHAPERDLLTVWNRGGTAEAPMIFLPKWKGQKLRIDTIGAGEPLGEGALQWEAAEGRLKIAFPDASTPMARTLSISGAGS